MVQGTDTPANLPPAVPPAVMWLPGSALNCYESDANLRSWLLTPGLLTERIRAAAGSDFRLRVLHEGLLQGEHVREITMSRGNEPWLFAHTRIPSTTLATHPWLGVIGDTTLGEALAACGDIERTTPRFAMLGGDTWIVARALANAHLGQRNLWVRHSGFHLGREHFDLYEIFMPAIATAEPAPRAAEAR